MVGSALRMLMAKRSLLMRLSVRIQASSVPVLPRVIRASGVASNFAIEVLAPLKTIAEPGWPVMPAVLPTVAPRVARSTVPMMSSAARLSRGQ